MSHELEEDRLISEGVKLITKPKPPTEQECKTLQSQMVTCAEKVIEKLKKDPSTAKHRGTQDNPHPTTYTREIFFTDDSYMNLNYNTEHQILQTKHIQGLWVKGTKYRFDESLTITLGSVPGFEINTDIYNYTSKERERLIHEIITPSSHLGSLNVNSQTPKAVEDALGTLNLYLADDV